MSTISEIYGLTELSSEITRYSKELLSAVDALANAGKSWANRENDYRRAKAIAFLNLKEGTIPEKQAKVDQVVEPERLASHIAEAEREACLERVRSLRAIVSAYQTLANVSKVEIEMSGIPQPSWGK